MLAWGVFAVVYLAIFILTTLLPMPLPWYDPLARHFIWQVQSPGVAIDFFGRLGVASLGGGVTAWVASRFKQRTDAWRSILLAWMLILLSFGAMLYMWILIGRRLS